jgi:ribosome biogenesis GTPase
MSSEEVMLELGWDDGFARHYERVAAGFDKDAPIRPGRVSRVDRSACTVVSEVGEQRAAVLGAEPAAVGDWVVLDDRVDLVYADTRIAAVLPRRTAFTRQAADAETAQQVVAANIDIVFLVNPLSSRLRPRRIERYLAFAWQSGATPVILLTKSDLVSDVGDALDELSVVTTGVDVHPVSTVDGTGVDTVRGYLAPGRTITLVGPSGAGKSTLVNALCGEERLATQEIRGDGKGRHTTTHRELVHLPGAGMLIDTPGMRALALWDIGDGISATFEDVETLIANCRFVDCAHDAEPGCAVREALVTGELDEDRYANYLKLQREQRRQELRRDARAMAEEKQRRRVRARALKKRPHR